MPMQPFAFFFFWGGGWVKYWTILLFDYFVVWNVFADAATKFVFHSPKLNETELHQRTQCCRCLEQYVLSYGKDEAIIPQVVLIAEFSNYRFYRNFIDSYFENGSLIKQVTFAKRR